MPEPVQFEDPRAWSTPHGCAGYIMDVHSTSSMHDRVSTAGGHAAPPPTGGTSDRLRLWTPPPRHVRVHGVKGPKLPTTQSKGHACALHERVSASSGQACPPLDGCASTERARDWTPEPHERLHGVYGPNDDTMQCVGQSASVQARVCCICDGGGHAAPPCAAEATIDRDRVCVPPPHVAEHAEYALNALTAQSTGQGCALHGRVSSA